MCGHPREAWVGTADGIHCSMCGTRIDLDKITAPSRTPKVEAEPEPEEKPKKAAPKKTGGRKNAGSK